MAYRKINPLLWDDPWFVGLDDFDRVVWFAILTGPQVRNIPGLMIATAATLADFIRRPVDAVTAALSRFVGAGKVERDENARLLRVVNAPRWAAEHGEPENPNVIKGWWRSWKELPDCETKRRHLLGLREAFTIARTRAVDAPIPKAQQDTAPAVVAARGAGWDAAWAATFGTVPVRSPDRLPPPAKPSTDRIETVPEPFGNGFDTVLTRTRACDEQEQEPQQEQEQEPSRAPAPAREASPVDQRVVMVIGWLRGSGDLTGLADGGQLDLDRCARDLVSAGDAFVMGGRLRAGEMLERLEAAVADIAREVAAAASTSQPMPPREVARKMRTFANTALGRSRDEWERRRPPAATQAPPSTPRELPVPPPPRRVARMTADEQAQFIARKLASQEETEA